MTELAPAPIEQRLKRVLRYLPAPVGIVSSFDPETAEPVGLAMSALMPVSLEPAAMAIAINRAGSAHDAMIRAGRFCINLLDAERQDYLAPFASHAGRADRFQQPAWCHNGPVWYIKGSPAAIFCTVRECMGFGTHDVLIGEVYDLIASGGDDILGWANGALGRLSPIDEA
ncbi:flavin reductase (DIM6/NTAB) family NADH-FMN oxidoreductase RutF [Novosphingobium kunmingense]|uniref:Flavin reductase (DIM6/NTAB) family NADH-FMN oxidoreductase RutF n=1 Tax=Novosphingobium kunmingense TaxID=1211806 RepID=A0A2N0H6U7_9SPHN|nr:flavin reductase family protein [Novosphingobium kunmingense]PKB14610.1 flavin reductase (DIM6/NTAB) family NADH-FMN oxidoreductase RutF [Novosphingobium kunmingense]